MPTKYRRGLLFVCALSLASVFAGWGVAQDDPVEARMRKDITFLASDECEGRGVGTKGLDLAADYIAAEFKKAGLKPGGVNGTWFQPFPFAVNAELDGTSTLVLQGPQEQKITLTQGTDFQVMGSSASGKLNAPVVFVGYGVSAPAGKDEKVNPKYDDYEGIDVKGKIVVVLRRLPRWDNKDLPFGGGNKDKLAALQSKLARAQAAGAAAIVLVNDASEAKDDLIPFKTLAGEVSTKALPKIPFIQVKRSFLDDLLRSGTGNGLRDVEKAIDGNLKPRSTPLTGWRLALDVKVKHPTTIVKNVIGVVEGKGPLANETIVVGAHYDHLGYGGFGSLAPKKKPGPNDPKEDKDAKLKSIHHGADDNGSGSTGVMELARRFGKLANTDGRRMVFMTFTAEERGLVGSRFYAREQPLFPLKDTAAMLNLDMIGRLKPAKDNSGKPTLLALGMGSGKGFEEMVTKLNTDFNIVKDNSVFGASDHYSFYSEKVPVLFFWTGTHSDYHRPTDTSDKINVAGMKSITDFSERILKQLRTDPKRPEYVELKNPFKGGGGVGGFPKLGIIPDYTFAGKGVLVEGISDGGPAATAGLKKGDVITEIAGKAVANVDGYMAVLRTQKAGVAVELKLLRDSKELMLKVTPK